MKETKAGAEDFLGRFREIVSDPNNVRIPRVHGAGFAGKDERFSDPFVVMHNGVKILLGQAGYYKNFSHILIINRGVHEPQEEYCFARVLDCVDASLPMLELGAYWGFYSLWYKQRFPAAQVFLAEPDLANLQVGKQNFELNNQRGHFVHNGIGAGGMDVIDLLEQNDIARLGILHADIQGAEGLLLTDISPALDSKRVDFLFVSTHSQELHMQCREKLERHGYKILAAADFDRQTFSYDGLIVACREEMDVAPFDIYSRESDSIDQLGADSPAPS